MPNKNSYVVGVLGIIAVSGILFWIFFELRIPQATAESSLPSGAAAPDLAVVNSIVSLTPEKMSAAQVQTGRADVQPLQSQRTIAGRLAYDQERHVEIKASCAGIITQILVQPGERVDVGQSLAVISSPAVGAARSTVKMRLAELELAETEQQRYATICHGVEKLVELIRARQTPEEISTALAGESLGEFREKIVSAYTRARLGQKVVANTRPAAEQGAIAVSVQQQRETEWQTAAAALEAVLDQSLFEVRQRCASSKAQVAQGGRLVEISLQELNTLLGPAAEPATRDQFAGGDDQRLSQVNLLAPIAGTLEERYMSVGERVAAGEAVIVVADVSSLWAVADVREHDWQAIAVEKGLAVKISSPALGEDIFPGEVLIVGRRVDPLTGAAPLIARLNVTDQRLRPGLFIRMTVPLSAPREVLAVPEQAVVVHEGQHFVFVARNQSTFQRADVTIGETQAGLTEIVDGLMPGTPVATSGVFLLKSELLLASDEE